SRNATSRKQKCSARVNPCVLPGMRCSAAGLTYSMRLFCIRSFDPVQHMWASGMVKIPLVAESNLLHHSPGCPVGWQGKSHYVFHSDALKCDFVAYRSYRCSHSFVPEFRHQDI